MRSREAAAVTDVPSGLSAHCRGGKKPAAVVAGRRPSGRLGGVVTHAVPRSRRHRHASAAAGVLLPS